MRFMCLTNPKAYCLLIDYWKKRPMLVYRIGWTPLAIDPELVYTIEGPLGMLYNSINTS